MFIKNTMSSRQKGLVKVIVPSPFIHLNTQDKDRDRFFWKDSYSQQTTVDVLTFKPYRKKTISKNMFLFIVISEHTQVKNIPHSV